MIKPWPVDKDGNQIGPLSGLLAACQDRDKIIARQAEEIRLFREVVSVIDNEDLIPGANQSEAYNKARAALAEFDKGKRTGS